MFIGERKKKGTTNRKTENIFSFSSIVSFVRMQPETSPDHLPSSPRPHSLHARWWNQSKWGRMLGLAGMCIMAHARGHFEDMGQVTFTTGQIVFAVLSLYEAWNFPIHMQDILSLRAFLCRDAVGGSRPTDKVKIAVEEQVVAPLAQMFYYDDRHPLWFAWDSLTKAPRRDTPVREAMRQAQKDGSLTGVDLESVKGWLLFVRLRLRRIPNAHVSLILSLLFAVVSPAVPGGWIRLPLGVLGAVALFLPVDERDKRKELVAFCLCTLVFLGLGYTYLWWTYILLSLDRGITIKYRDETSSTEMRTFRTIMVSNPIEMQRVRVALKMDPMSESEGDEPPPTVTAPQPAE